MNALTDESRDDVWPVNIDGFCSQLRAPSSLAFLKGIGKPAHLRLGDATLKAMLDSYLIALMMRGEYRTVTDTLVRLFGEAMTVVTGTDDRQRKPLSKAASGGAK